MRHFWPKIRYLLISGFVSGQNSSRQGNEMIFSYFLSDLKICRITDTTQFQHPLKANWQNIYSIKHFVPHSLVLLR